MNSKRFSKRAKRLADTILTHSLSVKKGDKLLISASDFSSEELLSPLYYKALKLGAIVHLDIFGSNFQVGRADYGDFLNDYYEIADKNQLRNVDVYKLLADWADKSVKIISIHDKNHLADIDSQKIAVRQKVLRPVSDITISKPWCLTYYPTTALAVNSGLSIPDFTEFYYNACNVDYMEMDKELLPLQVILDKGKIIEIKGNNIDLKLDISNRLSLGVDNGKHNIPDGECFIGPVEDKTEGFVKFELPQIYNGKEFENIYLQFKAGKIVKLQCDNDQKSLEQILNSDKGNKRLGEFGIGMNKNITKYIKDILFDEKIYGSVHFALGMSYPYKRGGGKNKASIHWDMVKDLRHKESIIKVDGIAIFKDGQLTI